MLLPLALISMDAIGQRPTPGKVYVVLWFDTEDYILPESDDAAKRLATFLTEQGIQATFKVVGEKARARSSDATAPTSIAALQKHAIGYHANTHSQHPTPAEYESLLNWETGVAEFTRRERPGYDDVQRIFKQKPCCYGTAGQLVGAAGVSFAGQLGCGSVSRRGGARRAEWPTLLLRRATQYLQYQRGPATPAQ